MGSLLPVIPAEIERAADEMPTFSPILGKVEELSREMNVSPRDLVKVVMLDPVLTGNVIKLVNSSFYGLGQKVQSLSQAVLLLGINTVKNLAISTVMISALFTRGKGSPIHPEAFWRHCLGTAACCKYLARALRIPPDSQEAFFVAGLIHDIGKILFIKTDPTRYEKALEESRRLSVSLAFAERSHFGCDHTHVGGLLARKWKLDTPIADVIKGHHEIPEKGKADARALVTISNNLCKEWTIGDGGNSVIEEMSADVSDEIGLGPHVLAQAANLLPEQLNKAEAFLNLFQEGGVS
ncbi:MAG: HDOD domain-containing protein [Deltaproteobacteria bacterium]|nr:HDOD domain-containing protein [Deltaproteobacteria bacterium]